VGVARESGACAPVSGAHGFGDGDFWRFRFEELYQAIERILASGED
jgi:hypothetical protein